MLRVAVAILPEVRQLVREDPTQLAALLAEMHDEDLADLLGMLNEKEASVVLSNLTAEDAAPIFERLDDDQQESIVETMGFESIAPIVSEMSADERTDLFDNLPDDMGEKLLETVERVDPQAAAEVEQLAKWPEDSAGGLMTTGYMSVKLDLTVHDVIERIREVGDKAETLYSVYVVGDHNKLHGVVSLRDLLLAELSAKVTDVMTENVFAVSPDTDQEEVARTMAKYDFSALPVVGAEKKLLGVITFDDVMDVLTQEQTEDMQRLGAVEPTEDPYLQTPFWTFIKVRGPWLVALFISETFTGTALRYFNHYIQAIATLSFYVPLLLSTGGNSGAQSASLILRGLAVGDVKVGDFRKVFVRELGQGLILGSILAVLGMIRVWMWGDGWPFMVLIGATLIAIPVMGCAIGSMLPLLLRRIGVDPARSSTPFVATLIDVLGIVVYFSIAKFALAAELAAAVVHR